MLPVRKLKLSGVPLLLLLSFGKNVLPSACRTSAIAYCDVDLDNLSTWLLLLSLCSDVWDFLLACKAPYCSLYDVGYTSIGNIHDTIPNPALRIEEDGSGAPEVSGTTQPNGNGIPETVGTDGYRYRPANELRDGRLERSGRFKKKVTSAEGQAGGANVSASERRGEVSTSGQEKGAIMVASVIIVGDELL